MRQAFEHTNFRPATLAIINTANIIITRYMKMGLKLTLRQLYYQFVAHHALPNTERSYQNLSITISNGRLAGLIDWEAIEDRGRVADEPRQWSSLENLVEIAIEQFRLPRWQTQPSYLELWVEKQALAGVLEPVAQEHHVTLMVNKGYSSQSAMYESAKRFIRNGKGKNENVLLYLGDHDPSGEDMVRDVTDRLRRFGVPRLRVKKVALTMDQVEEYRPPPNPAKLSDSRAKKYVAEHGASSWEVDALDPDTLVKLIEKELDRVIDRAAMKAVIEREEAQKEKLQLALSTIEF